MSCVEEDIYGLIIPEPSWTHGHAFTTTYNGDCYFVMNVDPTVVGAALGWNSLDESTHYNDLEYGFIFKSGEYRVVENGELKGSWTTFDQFKYFAIYRVSGTVYYCVVNDWEYGTMYFDPALPNVPLPGQVVYTSDIPSYTNLFIDSSLYSVYDRVCYFEEGVNWSPADGATNATLQGKLLLRGQGADDSVAGIITGELGLSGTASMSAAEGVTDGQVPIWVYAGDVFRSEMRGTLKLSGGDMTTSQRYDELWTVAQATGFLGLTGYGSGEPYIPSGVDGGELGLTAVAFGSEYVEATVENALVGHFSLDGAGAEGVGIGVELPITVTASGLGANNSILLSEELGLTLIAAGDAVENSMPLTSAGSGELGLIGAAATSISLANYFRVVLPELGGYAPVALELTDEIRATIEVQSRLVNHVREFIDLASNPRTFSQRNANVTDLANAAATVLPDFVLQIAETFNITQTMDARSVLQTLEEIHAAGYVQTRMQALALIVAAMTLTDAYIDAGGGSSGGGTGGGAILQSVGTVGDPAELILTGWFPAGTVLGLAYNTDLNGDNTVITTLQDDAVYYQAADVLAAVLNAEPDIAVTHVGGGLIEVAPAGGATTVTI